MSDRAVPIHRFFAGLTEYAFQTRLGVVDPPLVDYMTTLLTRFVRSDKLTVIRDSTGQPMMEVVDMLNEGNNRIGSARRDFHRRVGDYALFWAGLYPESLAQRPNSKDALIDYCEHGKLAYWIASTTDAEHSEDTVSTDVLERLSCEFELCAYGLREVRTEWERRDDGPGQVPLLIN